MKHPFLSLAFCLVLISCKKTGNVPSEELEVLCRPKPEITAPAGYKVKKISQLDPDGGFIQMQFVNRDIGYILGATNAGGYARVLKTLDGGHTWQDLKVNIPQHPVSMVFKNENYGLISVHDVSGCPAGCQYQCVVLKTEDGGKTWQEMGYPGLSGVLRHLQFDQSGNLYANLWLYKIDNQGNAKSTLMKSADDGKSWQVFYDSPDLYASLVTFSFQLYEDKVFAGSTEGKLLKIGKNGQLLETISTGQPSSIWDFKVIDEKNLVLVAAKTVKTQDGGKTWKTIYDRSARLIDFPTPAAGLMIQNVSHCPSDVGPSNDIIASTQSAGLNWSGSELATNLQSGYTDHWKTADGRYLILLGNQLLEISAE